MTNQRALKDACYSLESLERDTSDLFTSHIIFLSLLKSLSRISLGYCQNNKWPGFHLPLALFIDCRTTTTHNPRKVQPNNHV